MEMDAAGTLERAEHTAWRLIALPAIAPLTVLAGIVWAIAQPYRLTFLDSGADSVWDHLIQPQLPVAALGVLFHIAASIWIGGLVTLALIGWRLDRPQRHAFLRFSRIAALLIGIVLAAGIYLGLLRLPALTDVWTTPYGQVLMLKIALVGLALTWGATHHFLVRPCLERGVEPPGGSVGRSLMGESLVGVAVLLVAALLVNTAPPEERPLGAASTETVTGRP